MAVISNEGTAAVAGPDAAAARAATGFAGAAAAAPEPLRHSRSASRKESRLSPSSNDPSRRETPAGAWRPGSRSGRGGTMGSAVAVASLRAGLALPPRGSLGACVGLAAN